MSEPATEKKMVDVFSDVDRETAMTANRPATRWLSSAPRTSGS